MLTLNFPVTIIDVSLDSIKFLVSGKKILFDVLTGATRRIRTACPADVPEFSFFFVGICVAQSVFYDLLCTS